MKFLLTYRERRAETDPAAAQRRSARLLNERAMPPGLVVRELLSRIGGGGGYAVVETSDPAALEYLTRLFAAYDCRLEPVIDMPFNGTYPPSSTTGEGEAHATRLPEMPASEPHEGAFSDDDVYDTED